MTSTVKIQDATGPDREGSTRGRNFAAFARSFAARLRQRFSLEASSLAWVTMTERGRVSIDWDAALTAGKLIPAFTRWNVHTEGLHRVLHLLKQGLIEKGMLLSGR